MHFGEHKVYDFNVKNGYKGSYDDFISFATPTPSLDLTTTEGRQQRIAKIDDIENPAPPANDTPNNGFDNNNNGSDGNSLRPVDED